ncbi:cytoplasmic protein [Salmonella enterica subsp. enterica]|nr:cytoplasmic protein [Salmonella enterica subsp. enterica]
MMPTDGNDNTRKQDGAVFGSRKLPIPETLQCTENGQLHRRKYPA